MTNRSHTVEIHVSPQGNDSHDGTAASPLRTLTSARDRARIERGGTGGERAATGGDGGTGGRAATGGDGGKTIEIVLHEGVYRLEATLELNERDSGTEAGPTIWRSAEASTVTISGGLVLDDWQPVKDASILERLSPEARNHVLEYDLRSAKVNDFGEVDPASGKRMELYFRGKLLELARYPNDGYLTIAEVPQEGDEQFRGDVPHKRDDIPVGRHYGRFIAPDDRMSRWQARSDLAMHGYWTWDWADSVERIERFDPATREIFPAKPYHRYGYHKNQRFCFLNILEELDSPGEWYADRETGMLYLWPPSPIEPGVVTASITGTPLISLSKMTDVKISGIDFCCSRNSAIVMNGCRRVEIENGRFTNLGLHAITCQAGTEVKISGCELSELASGGIILEGGDRKTLKAGRCKAIGNHIHHFAQRLKTYHYGIRLDGVGNRIANNEIDHAPHSAIGWSGNDHVIELNEVHHVVTETNDAGACYNGRDPSQQGTVIKHNYWHHIGGIAGHGTNSIYFDDALCGNTVSGNVFFMAGVPGKALMGAMFIHGGRYNRIDNNLFIDCEQAYGESPWNEETWKKYSGIHGWHERLHVAVEIDAPPYSDRYPWLATIMEDTRPNSLARNLVCRCGRFLGRGKQELQNNLEVDQLPDFATVNQKTNEPELLICTEVIEYSAIKDFEPIPFAKIGRNARKESDT